MLDESIIAKYQIEIDRPSGRWKSAKGCWQQLIPSIVHGQW